MKLSDIVVTWPKTKPLTDYLHELRLASINEEYINFRVPRRVPNLRFNDRCFRVHDGFVRGFVYVVGCKQRNGVRRVRSDKRTGRWPSGWFIVCRPEWHEIHPVVPMKGFRGWRYFDYRAISRDMVAR